MVLPMISSNHHWKKSRKKKRRVQMMNWNNFCERRSKSILRSYNQKGTRRILSHSRPKNSKFNIDRSLVSITIEGLRLSPFRMFALIQSSRTGTTTFLKMSRGVQKYSLMILRLGKIHSKNNSRSFNKVRQRQSIEPQPDPEIITNSTRDRRCP